MGSGLPSYNSPRLLVCFFVPTPTVIIVALNSDSGLRTNTWRLSPFFIAHGVIVQMIISKYALFYGLGWVNLIFTALNGLSFFGAMR